MLRRTLTGVDALSSWLLGCYLDADEPPTGGEKPGASADKGDPKPGDAGGNGNPPADPATDTDKDPKPGDKSGKETKEPASFTPEQQKELNRLLAKERRETEARLTKEAEAKEAETKGEFEKLYRAEQAKVKELEPLKDRVTSLATLLHSQIDAETKDWVPSLKEQDPRTTNPDVAIEVRLDWVNRSRKLAEELSQKRAAPEAQHGKPSDVKTTHPEDTSLSRFRRPGARA